MKNWVFSSQKYFNILLTVGLPLHSCILRDATLSSLSLEAGNRAQALPSKESHTYPELNNIAGLRFVTGFILDWTNVKEHPDISLFGKWSPCPLLISLWYFLSHFLFVLPQPDGEGTFKDFVPVLLLRQCCHTIVIQRTRRINLCERGEAKLFA